HFLMLRKSNIGQFYVSPRQIRTVGACQIETKSNNMAFTSSFNGPIMEADVRSTTFVKGPQSNAGDRWSWVPQTKDAQATMGTEANWNGNTLVLNRSAAQFETWLQFFRRGAIVAAAPGTPPYTNWGWVDV